MSLLRGKCPLMKWTTARDKTDFRRPSYRLFTNILYTIIMSNTTQSIHCATVCSILVDTLSKCEDQVYISEANLPTVKSMFVDTVISTHERLLDSSSPTALSKASFDASWDFLESVDPLNLITFNCECNDFVDGVLSGAIHKALECLKNPSKKQPPTIKDIKTTTKVASPAKPQADVIPSSASTSHVSTIEEAPTQVIEPEEEDESDDSSTDEDSDDESSEDEEETKPIVTQSIQSKPSAVVAPVEAAKPKSNQVKSKIVKELIVGGERSAKIADEVLKKLAAHKMLHLTPNKELNVSLAENTKLFRDMIADTLCVARAVNLSAYDQVEKFVADSFSMVTNAWNRKYKNWCVAYVDNGSLTTQVFFDEVFGPAMMKHVYPMVNRYFQRPNNKPSSSTTSSKKRPLSSSNDTDEPDAKRPLVLKELDKMIEACSEQLKSLQRLRQMYV